MDARERYRASGRSRTCHVCGASDVIELHHRSYARLGGETLDDLVPLCDDHHDEVHRLEHGDGHDLWTAHEVVRERHLRREAAIDARRREAEAWNGEDLPF